MNDSITLTLIPVEGGITLPWRSVSTLLRAFESSMVSLLRRAPELEISSCEMVLIGAPVAGSVRFHLDFKISGTLWPKRRRRASGQPRNAAQKENEKRYRTLLEQVGVNALGGVIAAAVISVSGSTPSDQRYGPEAELSKLCAIIMRSDIENAIQELQSIAAQIGCQSAVLNYESFSPMEMRGNTKPFSIDNEDKRALPARLRFHIARKKPISLYLDGIQHYAYISARDDSGQLALIAFLESVPKWHLIDKFEIEGTRLKSTDFNRVFIHPNESFQAGKSLLSDVRSLIVVDRVVLPISLAKRHSRL